MVLPVAVYSQGEETLAESSLTPESTEEASTKSVAIDEKKMAKSGAKAFKKKYYEVAEKFYGQLATYDPKNSFYAFRYAVSLLNSSGDMGVAVKYFEKAVALGTEEKLVYLYLGQAYQKAYEFDKATKAYAAFASNVKEKVVDKYGVDMLLLQCKTARKLMKELRPLKVVSKKTISRKDFFRGYKFSTKVNKILIKPRDFFLKEDMDSKNKDPLLMV